MIVGVHHIGINTRNFDRMLRFYQEAFGFRPCGDGFSWENEPRIDQIVDVPNSAAKLVLLKAGNCYVELFEYKAPPPQSTKPLKPYDRGYTHLCIETDDIATDFEHLKKCGADFGGRDYVSMNDVGTIYGYDPEGNVFELQSCAPTSPQHLDRLKD
jgi:catechol 2,3-dioxygenase-like lactoylglutathione lyase family enzyme